jgi:molybdopterin-guanine dinucleotide biosynthesis protein
MLWLAGVREGSEERSFSRWNPGEGKVAIVVVGGHTRNVGKTSVVAGLIAALPGRRWTAVKITQFGHGVCSANGEPCDCETADHTIAITEERDPASGTDTSRYLAAGAERSFWVRTRQGQLSEAMPRLRRLLAEAENAIVESNSILRFLQPDVSLSVLDPTVKDFKPSALRYLDRVDALIVPQGAAFSEAWEGVSRRMVEGKRRFEFRAPLYCSEELVEFVAQRLMPEQSVPEQQRVAVRPTLSQGGFQ